MVNSRMLLFSRVLVLSIKIHSSQIASIITVDHPINIQHRHHIKNKIISQNFGLNRISDQIIDHILDQIGDHAFTRMHTGRDHNRFLAVFILIEFELGDF